MIKITKLECSHEKYGTWVFSVDDKGVSCVGGKPLPSEAEAHIFSATVLPALQASLSVILRSTFDISDY